MQVDEIKEFNPNNFNGNKKKSQNKLDLFLIIFCIASVSLCLFVVYGLPALRKNNVNNLLLTYEKSKEHSFLYYDYLIKKEDKEVFEECLSENKEVSKLLKDNNIRIAVTNDHVPNIMEQVLLVKSPVGDDAVGVYVEEAKIIVITPYKFKDDTSGDIKKVFEELKESGEELLHETIEEEIASFDKMLNRRLLLHEIGHFLDSLLDTRLSQTKEMKEAFNKEKDIVALREYSKSSESEYVAECIGNYLQFGQIVPDKDAEPNTTTTEKLIKETVDNLLETAK